MEGLTALTTLAGGVFVVMFTLMTVGHLHELKTGAIEGPITKIGALVMVGQVLIPITGLSLLMNLGSLVFTAETLMKLQVVLALGAFATSFGIAVVSMLVASDLANFIYTSALGKEPHANWQ